jgi:hypothetical protein
VANLLTPFDYPLQAKKADIRFMTNHEMKTPTDLAASGQKRESLQSASRPGEPLAALSPEHLRACRDAADIGPLIEQLRMLLAQREKRK